MWLIAKNGVECSFLQYYKQSLHTVIKIERMTSGFFPYEWSCHLLTFKT